MGAKPRVESSTRGGRIEWIATCPDEERICNKQQFKDPDKRRAVKAWEKHEKDKHKPERERRKRSEDNRKKQEKALNRRLDHELSRQEFHAELNKRKEESRKRAKALEDKAMGWSTGGRKNTGLHTRGIPGVPDGQKITGKVYYAERDSEGNRIPVSWDVIRRFHAVDDD